MASSHSNSFVKQSTVKRGIILGAILLLLILILHVGNPMMLSHKIKLAPTALRSPPTSARTACTAIVQDIVWRYPDTALIFFIFDFNCSATLSFAVSYVPKRAQTDSRASSGLCRSHNLDCSSDSPEWSFHAHEHRVQCEMCGTTNKNTSFCVSKLWAKWKRRLP